MVQPLVGGPRVVVAEAAAHRPERDGQLGVFIAGRARGRRGLACRTRLARTLDINLTGVFLCSRYAIPRLIERGGGSVISTSSIAGQVGGLAHAYAASKGAVIALGRSIAKAYGPQGVRSNVICPGYLETPMTSYLADPRAREHMGRLQLIPQIGAAEDVANLALSLASDESRWMTGGVLTLDGGVTIPLINPRPPHLEA